MEGGRWDYSLFYGGEAKNRSYVVDTYLIFGTNDENASVAMTILDLNTGGMGDPANDTGWYFEYWLNYNRNETPVEGYGYLGAYTGGNILIGFRPIPKIAYRLDVRVHVPSGLQLQKEYKSGLSVRDTNEVDPNPTTGENPITGETQYLQSFNYIFTITPTRSYFVQGTIYEEDGERAGNAKVTVKNENTGEEITKAAEIDGTYRLDLNEEMSQGYSDGDNITVTGKKGESEGKNKTVVSIPEYRLGPYVDAVDVYMKEPKEDKPVNYTLLAAFIILVIVVLAVLVIKSRQRPKKEEDEEEKKPKKKGKKDKNEE